MKFAGTWSLVAAAALVSSVLSACGGGGGDDDDDPQEPASLTITGVAATGAALDGATVGVKCAGDTASSDAVTTGEDGRYSVTVTNGTLPCVIRVTKDGQSLHSIVEQGATLPATANVTPLTELLTALVSGGPASALYDDFDSAAQADLTAAKVNGATEDLVESLANVVNLESEDLLKGELRAAVNGEGGNVQDQKLDVIAQALEESNTTLADLSNALTTAPGVPPEALSEVPTTASSCPSLRSGPFWEVEPANPERTLVAAPSQFDAQSLQGVSNTSGTGIEYSMTPVANQPCRFTVTGTDTDVVISRSGIGMTRFTQSGVNKISVVFPVQEQVPVAELAGDWNEIGYVQSSGTVTPFNSLFTIDTNGTFISGQRFIGRDDLQPPPQGVLQLVANPAGGFNITENGSPLPVRVFAHRAPNGVLTLFSTPRDGSPGLFIARKRQPFVLRAVGLAVSYWDVGVPNPTEIVSDANEIVATNPTANTETRRRMSDNRIDTRLFDDPRTGLAYRVPNSCTTGVNGSALNCAGSIAIGNVGTGFNANAGLTSTSFFSLSIIRP